MTAKNTLAQLRAETYTTAQMRELCKPLGIKFTTAYIWNVINNPRRLSPHPLLEARIDSNLWDKQLVDEWIASRKS